MVVTGGRRPDALKARLLEPRRERRAAVRLEYISGSQGEFDLVATRSCEIACFMNPLRPEDNVVVRERLDADEFSLVRRSGEIVIFDSFGFRVLPESFEAAAILIRDVVDNEDALLSSIAEEEAWIAQWVRLKRSTEYKRISHPLVLVDVDDPIYGILPVSMSEQRAVATSIPFLSVKSHGPPASILAAFNLIKGGDFGGTPYGGLWQVERDLPKRPSECVHRALAIFKRYAGLPSQP